jgi:hypothetical protein
MTVISVIVGSTREGRFSEKPAKWILQQLKKRDGVDARLLDLRDFPMPFFDQPLTPAMPGRPAFKNEVVQRSTDAIAQSDGFVFVTPEMIKRAESAAPPAVASGAAIYAADDKGAMRTLREGKNGFWCMPDNPASPGPDPMRGDANSMEWAMAWIEKKEPPKGKVGFMYMLSGGTDGSNTDPYATKPEEGNNWVETGPHVMIVNAMDMMKGYPADPKPDTSKPYVMWAGTPYAHLMIPVK